MNSAPPENKNRDTRVVAANVADSDPLSIAWPLSRIVFAGALIFALLALLLLVPPTKVKAEKAQQMNLLADAGIQSTVAAAEQADSASNPPQVNAAFAGAMPLSSGFVSASSMSVSSTPASSTQPALAQPVESDVIEIASAAEIVNETASVETSTNIISSEPVVARPVTYEEYVDWKTLKVRRGDTLTHVFKRAGLKAADAYQLMGRCVEAKNLSRIHPGHELDFEIEDSQLKKLRYRKSVLESQIYIREGDDWNAEIISRIPEVRIQYQQATLEDSLFLAGQRVGLDQKVIMQLANVFGGVIDFVFDPRKGDTFSIMYEDLYLDGEKIGNGDILAAEYVNSGDSFKAYRYEDSNGKSGYYAPDGVSMQKAFLRAPLDFKRISSSFNLRRKHPIHKRIKAHRGIDYAAPRGTPIFAAGDGRVVQAGYTRANGNYIVISHGPQYTTKYLHLTKRQVKNNTRVKKGQIIGTVGSTGYATGPHLHYEFLVNGVHRNPRTILNKLPKAKSIAANEMDRFENSIASLRLRLAKLQQTYGIAELDSGSYTLIEPGS